MKRSSIQWRNVPIAISKLKLSHMGNTITTVSPNLLNVSFVSRVSLKINWLSIKTTVDHEQGLATPVGRWSNWGILKTNIPSFNAWSSMRWWKRRRKRSRPLNRKESRLRSTEKSRWLLSKSQQLQGESRRLLLHQGLRNLLHLDLLLGLELPKQL